MLPRPECFLDYFTSKGQPADKLNNDINRIIRQYLIKILTENSLISSDACSASETSI